MKNAGENKLLQKRCESSDWKMGITFEYTARDTPQQNSLAELAFAIIANRGRAMMHEANLPKEKRFKLWHEAFKLLPWWMVWLWLMWMEKRQPGMSIGAERI